MNARSPHFDFRKAAVAERRDGQQHRRKEDLALLLAATNLKLMRDEGVPIEALYQQIDYLHDLVDQIMQKHRPQPEVPGVTRTEAAHEQTNAA